MKLHSKVLNSGAYDFAPEFVKYNIVYEVITGSQAYGCGVVDSSDIDVCSIVVPPKEYTFPHLAGYIHGFSQDIPTFTIYQRHHVVYDSDIIDVAVYGIVNFFKLAVDNNPNLLDILFTPQRCVLHSSDIGRHLRTHRKLSLSKKPYHRFFGYAFSQLNKAEGKALKRYVEFCKLHEFDYYTLTVEEVQTSNKLNEQQKQQGVKLVSEVRQDKGIISKRLPLIIQHGFDTKFASHVVRLLCEAQQILEEHDLDIERNADILKGIRRGEWSLERIKQYFSDQSKVIEQIYANSTLRYACDQAEIAKLLLECLEMHYGSLANAVSAVKEVPQLVSEIEQVLQKYKRVTEN